MSDTVPVSDTISAVLTEDAEHWIRTYVTPVAPPTVEKAKPWATTYRVPTDDGPVWFKVCAPVQAFEPRLTAHLYRRRPDLVTEVIAHDEGRAWLLMRDAGTPIAVYGNPPEAWLEVLPRYAELQRGETAHAAGHVAHGVTDRRLAVLPRLFDELVARDDLPVERDELPETGAVASLCGELAARGIPDSVQHDDLHMGNVAERDGVLRIMDWGDSSIAHPFFSLVVTFRFLEEKLPPGDPWFARLRDAYLEPWGRGLEDTFELAQRVGWVAHALGWARIRDHVPAEDHALFEQWYPRILRRAFAGIDS